MRRLRDSFAARRRELLEAGGFERTLERLRRDASRADAPSPRHGVSRPVGGREPVFETLFGSPERKRVHSLPVLGIAALPGPAYAAYLLPLRRQNETAAFLFANHVSYTLFDTPTEALVARSPRVLRRVARKLLPTRPPAGVYCAS